MPKRYDPQELIGKTFTRLTVEEFIGRDEHGVAEYRCTCACGNQHIAKRKNLSNGSTKSCGCLKFATRPKGEQTRYYTPEAKQASEWRRSGAKTPYKIIIHR